MKSTNCYEDENALKVNNTSQTKISDGSDYALKVLFPNPVHKQGTLNLLLSSKDQEQALLKLVDIQGRVLYSTVKNMVSGDNLIQVDLSGVNLFTQIVLAQVEVGGTILSRKILVVD